MVVVFALEWRHDAQRGEWVLLRSNARGATGAVVCMCGLGGTVIGGLLLGWLKLDEPVSRIFLGATIVLAMLAAYRLGSATRVTLAADGTIKHCSLLYGWRLRESTSGLEGAWVSRGMVQFYSPLTPESDGVWIGCDFDTHIRSVILARGARDEVDAYVDRLPLVLAARIRTATHTQIARLMPKF